jgi:hypothetical protein
MGWKGARRAAPRLEEASLSLGDFYWRGAFCVIVRGVIDPTAHRIAAHGGRIEGLQQLRAASTFVNPGSSHSS